MKNSIKHVIEDGWDDYVNEEFPPSGKISDRYSGYDTWEECMLFHEFAAIGYDMSFKYKGDLYEFYCSPDGVYLVKNNADCDFPEWSSANDMIREFTIDGKHLNEIVHELEDIDYF